MIPRCFVEPALWDNAHLRLQDDDSHHLADVLRKGEGDAVVVCDGRGGEALCRITGVSAGGSVTVEVLDRRHQPADMVLVTLVQAIPKSQKMEWIIPKATEIGVWRIVPVLTDRGVVQLTGERAEHRVERWRRIAVEAARQCRTAWIPQVAPIADLKHLLATGLGQDLLLVGSLEPDAVCMKGFLRARAEKPPRTAALMIGPEGDFSPEELKAAREAGAVPVSYGTRVLRVETAAIYGLSVLAYEFDGRGLNNAPAVPVP